MTDHEKNDFDLIENYFNEEYGVRLQPVVDVYSLDNYTRVKSDSIPRMNALFRDLPFFAAQFTTKQKTVGTYRVIFDKGLGRLQQSAANPERLRANVVAFGANNKIVSQAELEQFQLKTMSPLLTIFEVAAIITNQYYLARIDKDLDKLHKGIQKIERIFENAQESDLYSYEQSLQGIYERLSTTLQSDDYRNSTLTNVQNIRIQALSLVKYYHQERIDLLEVWAQESTNDDLVIQELLEIHQNKLNLYYRACKVFVKAYILEVILSHITDTGKIKEEIRGEINKQRQEYAQYFSHFCSLAISTHPDIIKAEKYEKGFVKGAATGVIAGLVGVGGLPLGGLVMGSLWVRKNRAHKKSEEVTQQLKEVENILATTELEYEKKCDIAEKSVSALEYLDCLYNNPVEILIKDDEMYLKVR